MCPEVVPGYAGLQSALATAIVSLGEEGTDGAVSQAHTAVIHHREPAGGKMTKLEIEIKK